MIERELNLHVPATVRAAIGKTLRAQKAKKQSLQARYFDTPGRELAHAKIALRLRLEGTQWVQTLKSPGADALSRIELNQPRPEPTLDLSIYKGTPAESALSRLKGPLALRFETKVTRLTQQVQLPDAVIEIAYDQGTVCADELELPISEIEFELISGNSDAIFTIGAQWIQQYGLIIDLRSKAERGDILAKIAQSDKEQSDTMPCQKPRAGERAEQLARPRRAAPANLTPKMSIAEAYLACANECLNQIIRNTAFAAGVDAAHAAEALQAEHIHQLRVGIRRLRSCWKLFSGWIAPIDESLSVALQKNFVLLGETRDLDVVKLAVAPQLKLANMPDCQLPPAAPNAPPADNIAASPEFQITLLGLLKNLVTQGEMAGACVAPSAKHKKTGAPQKTPVEATTAPLQLKRALAKRLNDWLEKITARGVHFDQLPIDEQHDLRKMVKRLRYSLDFSEGALTGRNLDPWHNGLTQTQQVLGELNDFYMADHFYQSLTPTQPEAWFAVGWLRARQQHQISLAQTMFKRLARLEPLKA